MSREKVEAEIFNWTSQYPPLIKLFDNGVIKSLINMCVIVTEDQHSKDELIENFIKGIVLTKMPKGTKSPNKETEMNSNVEELISQLTYPVINLLIERINSDDFRKNLIKKGISGKDKLEIDGVKSKISRKEILMHIKRLNTTVLRQKDISEIERSLIAYKRKQYEAGTGVKELSGTKKLLLKEAEIVSFWYQYRELVPEKDIELQENFINRFYPDSKCGHLIPEGKGGRSGDEYTKARNWRDQTLYQYLKDKKITKGLNFEVYTKNAFGKGYKSKNK